MNSSIGRERQLNSKKKVFILIIIFIFFSLSVAVGIKIRTTVVKKEKELDEIVNTIANYHYVSEIMNDVSYEHNNDEILIEVQFKDSFATLSTLVQFARLDAFCESIRDYMNVSRLNSDSCKKDFILISSNLGDDYRYESTCWNNEVKMKDSYGVLYVNDELVYSQEQYETHKYNHNDSLEEEFYNGYSDLEIMKYIAIVFNLITYEGKVRTPGADNKQIVDEVTERFGITQEDFRKIYKKYYYQYH